MDHRVRPELEAEELHRIMDHLRDRTDAQNFDLMHRAGSSRDHFSRRYQEAAADRGLSLADPDAREIVYGLPYDRWKALHHKDGHKTHK